MGREMSLAKLWENYGNATSNRFAALKIRFRAYEEKILSTTIVPGYQLPAVDKNLGRHPRLSRQCRLNELVGISGKSKPPGYTKLVLESFNHTNQ